MRARLHLHGKRSRVLLGTVSAVALLLGVAWTSGMSCGGQRGGFGQVRPEFTG